MLTLSQTYAICRASSPRLSFGGVIIAERHETSGSEVERLWAKIQQGCHFFVSQTVWSVDAMKRFLRDLRLRAEKAQRMPPMILMTLGPCGSSQTLHLQEWLGVAVSSRVKQDLLAAKDMLARSIELAVDTFIEVRDYAIAQGLSIGCNVESVSARPAELEASVELFKRIDALRRRTESNSRTYPDTRLGRTPHPKPFRTLRLIRQGGL
jgi:hypothetical protein